MLTAGALKLALCTIVLMEILSFAHAKPQCLTVRGKVTCGGSQPAETPIFIQLVDEDIGFSDDWMDECYASKTGVFQVHGCASDPFGKTIDPKLRIYHSCKGESRRRTVTIPKEAVKSGDYVVNGVINLSEESKEDVKHKYDLPHCSELGTSTGKPK
ncbi:Transthyretin-like protein 46 [Trichinella sp. T8]|nr:Transthyretin-like protein 46 [Trichinella sp. T8]